MSENYMTMDEYTNLKEGDSFKTATYHRDPLIPAWNMKSLHPGNGKYFDVKVLKVDSRIIYTEYRHTAEAVPTKWKFPLPSHPDWPGEIALKWTKSATPRAPEKKLRMIDKGGYFMTEEYEVTT